MAQKIVGVDLGAHHIKVVVVSSGIRGVQVLDAFEEPVGHMPSADDEEAVDPLGMQLGVALNALRRKRLMGNPTAIALPPGLLSYRVLSFPFSDERRIAQAVSFEAEGQFPVPLDQLAHGHVVVPTPGGGGRALVVAAKSERVGQISGVFRQAGVDVKLVTSGAVSMAQVANPSLADLSDEALEKGLQPASVVLEIGHETTQMIALGPKGPLAVRTQRRGGKRITAAMARAYSLDIAEAEAAKHSDGFVPHRGYDNLSNDQLESGRVVAEAIEPIVRELQHTRLWLRSTYNLEVGRILLAGGGADLQGIDEYLAEHTELPVERVAPKPGLVKGVEGREWTTMAGALGAAYGLARRPLVQLHESEAASDDTSWIQERMTSLIAIGVAIMAFGALDTIAQVKALEAEQERYEEELALATMDSFGEELMTSSKIEAKLASVQGADLTSLVPEKGAVEVLAMVVDASTPSDLAEAQAAAAAAGTTFVPGGGPPAGVLPSDDPSAMGPGPGMDPITPEVGEEPAEPAPVPTEAGVVVADDLIIESVEIRPQAIDLRANANVSSAQDRLNYMLKQKIACITSVSNGKTKARGDKKQFDMAIQHNCYYAQKAEEEAEPEEEAEE